MDCILYIQYEFVYIVLINHVHITVENVHLPSAVLIGISALIVANFNLLMKAWSVLRSLNVGHIVTVVLMSFLNLSICLVQIDYILHYR